MTRILSVDIISALHKRLRDDRRAPDGLLHASSDLVGSLRHSMLRAAGAPTVDSELVSDITLATGTFWHRYVSETLVQQGVPFMQEVDVTPWLPEGWSGTADWMFWHPKKRAFALADLKTTKGEAIRWLRDEGAKQEHIWQLSAYWHALAAAGFPLIKGFAVLYLPKNNVPDKTERIEPILHECEPILWGAIKRVMDDRWALTNEYLRAIDPAWNVKDFLHDTLAPEQERVQKYWWNKKLGVFDVKLVPHWSAQYCPYPNELCACNEQGTTKIGHYDYESVSEQFLYVPREGFEEIEVTVWPTEAECKKREKELCAT